MTPIPRSNDLRDSKCPAKPNAPRHSLRLATLAAATALSLVGCEWASQGYAYRGTASLQASGTPTQVLGVQSLSILSCADETWSKSTPSEFMVLGEQCILRGTWRANTFVVEPGGQCSFELAGIKHSLKVTDGTAHFGENGRFVDRTFIEAQLGGDASDATPAQHVLYRFTGGDNGSRVSPASTCDQIRAAAS